MKALVKNQHNRAIGCADDRRRIICKRCASRCLAHPITFGHLMAFKERLEKQLFQQEKEAALQEKEAALFEIERLKALLKK
jgi:hypothetical protein